MKIRKGMTLVIMLAWAVFGASQGRAEEPNNPKERTLKVQGEGKVTAVPDQAVMEIEVKEEGTEVEDASALVQAKMERVFRTIKSFGIPDKDTQTLSYNVGPKMKYDRGETKKLGYIVSNRIRVVVKNIDLTGKILKSVIQDGVDSIDGPTFGFSDPAKLKIEALKAAVEDAHAKAVAIAQSAEVDLGKVFSVSQTGLTMPTPRQRIGYATAGGMSYEGAQVPIATGENEVVAQVEVIYSLK